MRGILSAANGVSNIGINAPSRSKLYCPLDNTKSTMASRCSFPHSKRLLTVLSCSIKILVFSHQALVSSQNPLVSASAPTPGFGLP